MAEIWGHTYSKEMENIQKRYYQYTSHIVYYKYLILQQQLFTSFRLCRACHGILSTIGMKILAFQSGFDPSVKRKAGTPIHNPSPKRSRLFTPNRIPGRNGTPSKQTPKKVRGKFICLAGE